MPSPEKTGTKAKKYRISKRGRGSGRRSTSGMPRNKPVVSVLGNTTTSTPTHSASKSEGNIKAAPYSGEDTLANTPSTKDPEKQSHSNNNNTFINDNDDKTNNVNNEKIVERGDKTPTVVASNIDNNEVKKDFEKDNKKDEIQDNNDETDKNESGSTANVTQSLTIPDNKNDGERKSLNAFNTEDLHSLKAHTFTVVDESKDNTEQKEEEKEEIKEKGKEEKLKQDKLEKEKDKTQTTTSKEPKTTTSSSQPQQDEKPPRDSPAELSPPGSARRSRTSLPPLSSSSSSSGSRSRKNSTKDHIAHEDEASSNSESVSRGSMRLRSSSQMSSGVNTASSENTIDSPGPAGNKSTTYSLEKCSRSWRTALKELKQNGTQHSEVYRGPRWKMMLEMKRLC